MKQTNDLRLPLIRKWYDMTTSGIKSEDYREITQYWFKRFFNCSEESLSEIERLVNRAKEGVPMGYFGEWELIFQKKFTHNIMTLGYPKSGDPERTATFKHAGIEIRTGNPEFGAEPNKLYFVIKHGEKVEQGEEFNHWFEKVQHHLVKTKRIKDSTILHEPSFRQMYDEGFSIREAVLSSTHDDSITKAQSTFAGGKMS